jgi:hypothetical protein
LVCIAIARAGSAGEPLLLEWTATASDADGEASGRFEVAVDATALTPLGLLGEDNEASEGDEDK